MTLVRFEDFVLQFDTSSRGGFRARVLKSPFGEGNAAFTLPSLGGAAAFGASGPTRNFSLAAAPMASAGAPPLALGAELYRQVFQGQVRTLLDKTRGQIERAADLGVRLKIKIDPSDDETGALADLPWELLCDETEDFLALSRQTSVVRYLDVPRSSQPIAFTEPLRILAAGATPRGMAELDLGEEMRRLEELNRSAAGVEVQLLPHASAGALRELLSSDTFNVLHFMGHGTFDRASGEGMLAFEAADGSAELVNGKAFATKLRDLRSLGVVVLNACDTARAQHESGTSPFRGVATALVLGGLPAVVAMQRPISDRAAIGFSTAFYRHLARGDSIDEALTEGRQAIHSAAPQGFEWATPVLFLRIPEGNVFVAKAAERIEAPAAPPVAPAETRIGGERSAPAPRRSAGWKIGTAAAGTALAVSVFYGAEHFWPRKSSPVSEPSLQTDLHPSGPGIGMTTDGGGASDRKTIPAPVKQAVNRDGGPVGKRENQTSGTDGSQVHVQPPPVTPTDPQGGKPPLAPVPPPAAPQADLSSLTAQLVSIARRNGGGLRVTVAFKNSADQPLSAVLDRKDSVLSDDLHDELDLLASDLPATADGPRLDLAAAGSSRHTFDFLAPKVGSTKFFLTLSAQGRMLTVTGSPLTLEGPPS